jgi:hypothetical protein
MDCRVYAVHYSATANTALLLLVILLMGHPEHMVCARPRHCDITQKTTARNAERLTECMLKDILKYCDTEPEKTTIARQRPVATGMHATIEKTTETDVFYAVPAETT